MFISVEEMLLADAKRAWPYLSLDDQKRWCVETDYSKNPRGASKELIQTVQHVCSIAQWEERYGDYNRFMNTPPRSHNGLHYRYGYSTFERCAQQIELRFDGPMGRPPRQNASGKRVAAMLGPNGPAWSEEDCCVRVVHDGWAGGRELIIQNNHCVYARIRLCDDV